MKKLLFFVSFLYSGVSFAQENDMPEYLKIKLNTTRILFLSKERIIEPKLDFLFTHSYDAVQFVKTGQGFEVAYTVTVSVFDERRKSYH
jgi:hypothetical protein